MKFIKLILLLAASAYLSGCASGAKMENMLYQGEQKSYSNELQNNLEVSTISGGQKTNPAWTSEISNEAFSGAVKESLLTQGLLSDDGKYKMEIKMLKVEQPIFGLDLKVTTYVQYILTDSTDDSIVFDETIIAPHTATFSDAFVAVQRLRLANEGSGKKNIEGLLEKLATLDIGKNEISLAD
ncbi:MAG: hypothetical protein ACKE8G_03180 [Methylophagaceae bacterium]